MATLVAVLVAGIIAVAILMEFCLAKLVSVKESPVLFSVLLSVNGIATGLLIVYVLQFAKMQ